MRRFQHFSLSIFVFLFVIVSLNAQSEKETSDRQLNAYYFQKGQHSLNVGTGLITNPTKFSFDLFTGGSGTGEPTPSIDLNYEYGITSQIGLGIFLSYYRVDAQQELSIEELINGNLLEDPLCLVECLLPISIGSCDCGSKSITERNNVFTVAGKFTYHFRLIDKIDTYTSITAGYSFNRRQTIVEELAEAVLDQINFNSDIPTFVYFAAGGARYYFSPNWAAYGEFGYSNIHLLRLGLTYRW